jgi:hypothetical protein
MSEELAIASGDAVRDDDQVVKQLTPSQATHRGWAFLIGGVVLLAVLWWLP